MNPFKKKKEELINLENLKNKKDVKKINEVSEDIFFKCDECETSMLQDLFILNNKVCFNCNKHFNLGAHERIEQLFDQNSFKEMFNNLGQINYLNFPDYDEKLESLALKTGLDEAVITGTAKINQKLVAVALMDNSFLMGSMGSLVGEKLTKLIEYATLKKLPLFIQTTSGGARMQEGIMSLMQMAKTSAAIKRHHNKGLLYVVLLCHPTTGGVSASFASLADITLAEPRALIGFAGPRVIEQTIKEKLPAGFQSAEFLEECGYVDKIVSRADLKKVLDQILILHR